MAMNSALFLLNSSDLFAYIRLSLSEDRMAPAVN